MNDVSKLFQRYKEASRILRNNFYNYATEVDWDLHGDYLQVDRLLFQHLVVNRLAIDRSICNWLQGPTDLFTIISTSTDLPITINRNGNSGYWDNPIDTVKKGDLEIHFICYFDWDPMDQIDFRYYRGRIASSDKFPHLVGNDVLIETIYAAVLYNK